MKHHKTLMSAATLVAMCLLAGPAFAQLAVNKGKGVQKVELTDSIRKNVISWLSDAPMEKIKGTAPNVVGRFTMDPANMKAVRGVISVPVKGMETGNPIRDRHLRGKKWLNADKFPSITFKISKIVSARAAGTKAYLKAKGVFSCHGVSKIITVPVQINWKEASAKTSSTPGDWIKIKTSFEIKLADYKVAGKAGIVGNKVGKKIKITATLYGHTVR